MAGHQEEPVAAKIAGKWLRRTEIETLPESPEITGNALADERGRGGAPGRVKGATFALLVLFGINLPNFFDRHIPDAPGAPVRERRQ